MNKKKKIEISISVGNAKNAISLIPLLPIPPPILSCPDIMQSHNQSLHTV